MEHRFIRIFPRICENLPAEPKPSEGWCQSVADFFASAPCSICEETQNGPTAISSLRTTSSRGRLDFHLEAKAPDRVDVRRIECTAIVLQIALGRRLPLRQLAETAEFISGNIRSSKFAQSSDFARGRKTKLIEVHAQKMIWPEISPKIDSALICAHPILERGGRRLRFRSRRFQTEKE